MKARQQATTKAIAQAEGPDRQGLGARGAAKRRKYLLSGLLRCGACGGPLIVAGSGNSKGYYCANANQKGPAICLGMPGLRKDAVEEIVLGGLREILMRPKAVAQFRKDYPRHLAELNCGASQRNSQRAAAVRSLEQKL